MDMSQQTLCLHTKIIPPYYTTFPDKKKYPTGSCEGLMFSCLTNYDVLHFMSADVGILRHHQVDELWCLRTTMVLPLCSTGPQTRGKMAIVQESFQKPSYPATSGKLFLQSGGGDLRAGQKCSQAHL